MTRRRLTVGWHLLATMSVLLLTACGVPDTGSIATQPSAGTTAVALMPVVTAPQNTLTDGSWRLVSFGSSPQLSKPISNTLSLRFKTDGKFGGSGGCNSLFGSYTITGTLMTINEMGWTEMACMPRILMTQEAQYLAALNSVSAFVQTDTTLTLRYPEGELVFEYVPPPPVRTLENTLWHFNGFLQGDAAISSGARNITAELRDGTITGNGGCNRYNGSVTIQKEQLQIGPIVSTKMACDALEAEQQFLTALQTMTTWEIKDQLLILHGPNGGLFFVAQ